MRGAHVRDGSGGSVRVDTAAATQHHVGLEAVLLCMEGGEVDAVVSGDACDHHTVDPHGEQVCEETGVLYLHGGVAKCAVAVDTLRALQNDPVPNLAVDARVDLCPGGSLDTVGGPHHLHHARRKLPWLEQCRALVVALERDVVCGVKVPTEDDNGLKLLDQPGAELVDDGYDVVSLLNGERATYTTRRVGVQRDKIMLHINDQKGRAIEDSGDKGEECLEHLEC